MNNSGFLKGNKNALIVLIITLILSGILIFSGIVLNAIGLSSSEALPGSATKTITRYDDVQLSGGENKFKFNASTSGYYTIYLDSTSGVSSIKVTDSSGSTLYSTSSPSASCKFYVYPSGTVYITITLKSGYTNEFYVY